LALSVAILLLTLQSPSWAAVKPHTTLPIIERQVMCVTCKIPLNVAQSPQAEDERAFIQELIDKGQGEAQIKRALVAQYGRDAPSWACTPTHPDSGRRAGNPFGESRAVRAAGRRHGSSQALICAVNRLIWHR
jgi:hypothetical protein